MKHFWKTLGIAALAAALVPYRIEGDKETGSLTLQALLWKATEKVKPDGAKELNIKLLPFGGDEEDDLFTDDPDEAVLFADHDPEAAIVAADLAQAEADAAQAAADEAQAEADLLQAAADEAQAAADDAAIAADGAADFDPEA